MTTKTQLKEGDLQVWWIPQIPGKAFEVPVDSMQEGKKLMEVLADYDAFQFRERIKPDYSNTGGLARLEKAVDLSESDQIRNRQKGIPEGYEWIDIEASELWEEWEALNQ